MANNDLEILIEHFEFSPISVIDDVIDSVNELMYQALIGLERFVEKKSKSDEEIDQGMHQVETLLEALIDHNFDMFELYVMRNIFAIPENLKIILPHQEGMDFTLDQSREEKVDAELELMRKKVLALLAIKKITGNIHSQINEEKISQYASTSDKRETFVSTMVLRQTEQVKMQQRENRRDIDEEERLRKRARIDDDDETSKAIAQELKDLEMISNLFTSLNQEYNKQE
ncbi:4606_t:CDS:2 [Acaulospora colombiana]|uniref:4606_t:CDS:1 n=1 Tax=Acaulospora colombiana TaxID=27376 RepID=A0ACA9N6R9_9GLOM|nr:4606_t:CDS:2 [Acaulospora colombiana]